MSTKKRAKAPKTAAAAKPFSLVSEAAQQEMYRAIAALKPVKAGKASGAEIAEIAVRVALGDNDAVILACPARGARTLGKGGTIVSRIRTTLASATSAAVAALLADSKASVLVCAGKLRTEGDGREDYRSAFRFAARHKLPILFLAANTLTPGHAQELDLQALHTEFGIPVFSVDANDAIAAYRVATEALHNARHLRGPCVIEALTITGNQESRAASPLDLLLDYMERHGNRPR